MNQIVNDPVYHYFIGRANSVEPEFLGMTGVLRGYKVSFPTWNFIYLFEPPSTLNVIEFSGSGSVGLRITTLYFIRAIQELHANVAQIKKIIGATIDPNDPIEERRAQLLLSIFSKFGAHYEMDDDGYPCLVVNL